MSDEMSIRETVSRYADGMQRADVGELKEAFHEVAILAGYLGDEMIAGPIQGLYDWVETTGASEHYGCTIIGVEVTGRVATAKVRETDDHGDVIDHFHLLKVDDRWWIVSKIWDSAPGSEK